MSMNNKSLLLKRIALRALKKEEILVALYLVQFLLIKLPICHFFYTGLATVGGKSLITFISALSLIL